ncbi:MAG: hypothetical protein D6726_11995 [Nitrospirae bacterium]|nr:MAG: hypothetical protein D6726_11995 [Nitrospirota bacterium]
MEGGVTGYNIERELMDMIGGFVGRVKCEKCYDAHGWITRCGCKQGEKSKTDSKKKGRRKPWLKYRLENGKFVKNKDWADGK